MLLKVVENTLSFPTVLKYSMTESGVLTKIGGEFSTEVYPTLGVFKYGPLGDLLLKDGRLT